MLDSAWVQSLPAAEIERDLTIARTAFAADSEVVRLLEAAAKIKREQSLPLATIAQQAAGASIEQLDDLLVTVGRLAGLDSPASAFVRRAIDIKRGAA